MDPDESVILQYFAYSHLSIELQTVGRIFSDLAWALEALIPKGPEKTTALRKLLESKDAAVRAALPVNH